MSATVTMGPTIVNPAALTSVEELRTELTNANNRLFEMALECHEQEHVVRTQAMLLNALVDAHLANDLASITKQLAHLTDVRREAEQAAQAKSH